MNKKDVGAFALTAQLTELCLRCSAQASTYQASFIWASEFRGSQESEVCGAVSSYAYQSMQ